MEKTVVVFSQGYKLSPLKMEKMAIHASNRIENGGFFKELFNCNCGLLLFNCESGSLQFRQINFSKRRNGIPNYPPEFCSIANNTLCN